MYTYLHDFEKVDHLNNVQNGNAALVDQRHVGEAIENYVHSVVQFFDFLK